jgi:hypothetical protein
MTSEIMEDISWNDDGKCKHEWLYGNVYVTEDHYGEGWHKVVQTSPCKKCNAVIKQTWKTDILYWQEEDDALSS